MGKSNSNWIIENKKPGNFVSGLSLSWMDYHQGRKARSTPQPHVSWVFV